MKTLDLRGLRPTLVTRLLWIEETLGVYGYLNLAHIMRRFALTQPPARQALREYMDRGGNIQYSKQHQFFFRPDFKGVVDLGAITFVMDNTAIITDATPESDEL